MATVALVSTTVVCSTPLLIKRFKLTGGATGAAITHGETSSPAAIFSNVLTQTPTVTTVAVARTTSATTFTVDCLGDAADDIEVYAVWPQQSSGGLGVAHGA